MSNHLTKANLNLLVIFDILMKEQNLTKTGQQLNLSQPAISHALKGLREMFNDELFFKGPGGMRPTDHALRLIEPVRQALALPLVSRNFAGPNMLFDCPVPQ